MGQKVRRHFPKTTTALIVGFLTLLPFGTAELTLRILSAKNILTLPSPMVTVVKPGTEDWRLAHAVADTAREPDPDLFWINKPEYPHNAQRFRGPLMAIPKPPNTFRVITYGDSNTDGDSSGSWTDGLGDLFKNDSRSLPHMEILNAGVWGYSSYQGLRRFEREVQEFKPDVIFVSFGWNDLASTANKPDNSYKPLSKWSAAITRVALKSQTVLWLNSVISHRFSQAEVATIHRVSPDDYLGNLKEFARVAHDKNIRVIFLTRPYTYSEAQIEKMANWRRLVPAYNVLVKKAALETGSEWIDIQRLFENHSSFFQDECHFSPAGRKKMAEILFSYLSSSSPEIAPRLHANK